MYSEKDLKIVETSVPIYVKEEIKNKGKKPKRGHFRHSNSLNCTEKELSPVRRYTTALVYDFDRMGPQFAFLFSRDDTFYQNTKDRLARTLAMTVNFDWAYLDRQQVDNHTVYVRGWWNVLKKKKFVHKTGKLELKDHIDLNEPQLDGEGQPLNPEYGIKLFIPNYPGIYRSWEDIEQIGTWTEEQIYENTFVHPISDKAVGITPPSWTRYGDEKKPAKKKRFTREQRLVEEMRAQRAAQVAQLEEDARLGRRPLGRRRRQTAQEARPLVAEEVVQPATGGIGGLNFNVEAANPAPVFDPGEWDDGPQRDEPE